MVFDNTTAGHEKGKGTPSPRHAIHVAFTPLLENPCISFQLQPEKRGRKFHWITTPSQEFRGDPSPLPRRMPSTYRTVLYRTMPSRTTEIQGVSDAWACRSSESPRTLGNPLHRAHWQMYGHNNPQHPKAKPKPVPTEC